MSATKLLATTLTAILVATAALANPPSDASPSKRLPTPNKGPAKNKASAKDKATVKNKAIKGRKTAASGKHVASLLIEVQTGGDDLRSDSEAIAIAELQKKTGGLPRKASVSMNNKSSWGNNSTNTVTLKLPAGTTVKDIQSFRIKFTSGQPNVFATGDNWDMAAITVTAVFTDQSRSLLIQQSGSPLWRFKSDRDQAWSVKLK